MRPGLRASGIAGAIVLALLAAAHEGTAFAQVSTPAASPIGTVTGTVSDESGAVVVGVDVTLTPAAPGAQRLVTTTDAQGAYVFASLPPGVYTLTAIRDGFAPVVVDSLSIKADERRTLPLRLSVALSEGVAVIARNRVPTRAGTAMRTDTPLIETPQSVSVITRDQIEAQAAQTMEEVVRYTAGVRAEMYGPDNRGDWFSMRGGSEGSVVLDGLRQPLSGWWGNVRNEPYAYDRVEVVRGPASVMFGQNGPGGIVNLVSKLPQAETRREVSVQFGNRAHKQVAADLTGPLTADGRLLYRVVFLAKDTDTQVDLTEDERQYLAPSLAWRPNDMTSLTMFAQYQHDESDNNVGFFPWEGTRLPSPIGPTPDDLFIGEPAWDSYGGRRVRAGYQFSRRLSNAWTLRHNLRHDNVDGHVRAMYANFWEGLREDKRSVNRTWYANETETRITNTDVLAEGKFTLGRMQHTILVGADSMWASDRNPGLDGEATPLDLFAPVYGTFPLPPLDFADVAPTRTRQVGILAQDQIKIDNRIVVVAGLRRDYAKTEVETAPDAGNDDAAWTRRVGLVYLFNGGLAPYASYSDSFEAITGGDVFGTPFRPKRGRQVEGGLKWSPPDSGFSVTAAAYDLHEKNRLTTDPTNPLNQVQRGEVGIQGAEVEATINLPAWDLLANYTFTDATVTASSDPDDPYLGKRLHSIPEHSAALWAVRRFTWRGALPLQAGLGVRYVGETWDGTDTLSVPSTTLVDALFGFTHGPLRFSVNASNLFDKQYIATCIDRGDCWFGNRRKIVATLTYRR